MQDKPVGSFGSQPAAPAPADKPFLTPLHYPGDLAAPRPTPARAASPAGRGRLFTRVVLPLVLFVAVVAGTAWVTQYLPNWRKRRATPPVVPPGTALLQFEQKKAVWDPEDKDFAAEFEFGKEGFYDFPFTNPTAVPVQLGVSFMSCGCSTVSASIQKDDWQILTVQDTKGITIPPQAKGVVRLMWTVRKTNSRSNLAVKLWTQTEGRPREQNIDLEALVAFVLPVRFSPHIKDFGTLVPHGVGHAEFWFWSGTRDHFDLDVKEKKDNPCFVFEAKPLSAAECRDLEKRLKDMDIGTHIKAAYRVNVDVYEERGGQNLDLGPFVRTMTMTVDHNDADERVGPQLKGFVRGAVEVGNAEDQGRVDLKSFPVNGAHERRLSLATAAEVKLVPDQVPDFLDVAVTPKKSANGKASWELRVAVKPGVLRPGPLPEDSAIILRMESMPPRRIRIPVLGNAVQR